MAEISINEQDRQRAEDFLATTLGQQREDLSFEKGSVFRDLVDSLAHIFAILRKEGRTIRKSTSLALVDELENQTDIDEAVENILANWFITRNEGTPVQGSVLVHFSQQNAGTVPANATFSKGSLTFEHSNVDSLFYTEADLEPVLDSEGSIISYVLRVPVEAEEPGAEYEISTGPFDDWTDFAPYIIRVENDEPFVGGQERETTEQLLERGQTAATNRVLVSPRAIDTTLKNRFANIRDVSVVGYGSEEMVRDQVDFLRGKIDLSTGGKYDVYVTTPIQTKKRINLPVNGEFVDPSEKITFFDDPTVGDWRIHVEENDILRIWNASLSEPDEYIINEVHRDYLQIEGSRPFPDNYPTLTRNGDTLSGIAPELNKLQASTTAPVREDIGRYVRIKSAPDQQDVNRDIRIEDIEDQTAYVLSEDLNQTGDVDFEIIEDLVVYSIGDIAPDYDNKISQKTTGNFTSQFRLSGAVLLPAEPVYRITDVSISFPNHPLADDSSGRIRFERREDNPQIENGKPGYTLESPRPLETNSSRQLLLLQVGQEPVDRPDKAEVMYDSQNTRNLFKLDPTLDPKFFFDTQEDLGKHIFIFESFNKDNRGEFEIIDFVDEKTAVIENVTDSSWTATAEVRIPWKFSRKHEFDDEVVRVQYDTVQSFDAITAYAESRSKRPSPPDLLVKAPHGITISTELRYTLKSDNFDEEEAKKEIARKINNFPTQETLHTSEIVSFLQNGFSDQVGSVQLPVTVSYRLYAPDGRAIDFETQSAVELKTPKISGDTALDDLEGLSVFDSTVRYMTFPELITLTDISDD